MTLSDLRDNILLLLENSKVNLSRNSEKKQSLLDTISSVFDDIIQTQNTGSDRVVVMKPKHNPLDCGKGVISMTESESGKIDDSKRIGGPNVIRG